MKKVLKNKTGGEVQKSQRTATAAAVTPRSGHLGSLGQVACDDDRSTKVNDFGNVEGKPDDTIPCCLDGGKLCAAPSRRTTPQPPTEFEMAPEWMAAWQTKLSARYVAGEEVSGSGPPTTSGW